MSETTPEVPATEIETPTATATPEPTTETPKPTETVDFWKRQARENETRAKANADAAKRLQEIEDSQRTDSERLAARQAAVERERDDARAEGLRYKAAARHRIDEDYFDLLGSGDEEAINQRAERLGLLLSARTELEQVKAELAALREGKPAPTTGRPVEQLRPGATPTAAETEDDVLYHSLFGTT